MADEHWSGAVALVRATHLLRCHRIESILKTAPRTHTANAPRQLQHVGTVATRSNWQAGATFGASFSRAVLLASHAMRGGRRVPPRGTRHMVTHGDAWQRERQWQHRSQSAEYTSSVPASWLLVITSLIPHGCMHNYIYGTCTITVV